MSRFLLPYRSRYTVRSTNPTAGIILVHNPLTTLKLVCNLRGVRGTGKSNKEGFYTASFWLYKHHPKTLAFNVKAFADFGYFKDFPEILYRIIEGPDVREVAKQAREAMKKSKKKKQKKRKFTGKMDFKLGSEGKFEAETEKITVDTVENSELCNLIDKDVARRLRKEREIEKARKASDKYESDENYRLLFDCVADFFAEMLNLDLKALNSKEFNKISLASKWCPSIDSSYDKATLLCEAIACRIFPRESYDEYKEIEESHYVFHVRDRLRKDVLVPLHKVLQLPEVYMSANQWNSLPYSRVPSVAMKNYKSLFEKHDGQRFDEYLEKVESGTEKIAAGALLSHEIISALKKESGSKVAELQWMRIVDDMGKKGKLRNCIAVCDVSGSMSGTPMEVCVALGLLVSDLSEEPWSGRVITFSQDPQLHLIKGDSLAEKVNFVRNMDWGYNTDFQKVFDRILDVAVENKLSEDQLMKRVFVFSDMEFDEACRKTGNSNNTAESNEDGTEENKSSGWETDYQVIQRKFKDEGYNKVPEIVFWNLRNSSSTPVVANQTGVALVSGFSKNLLTLFLEEGGVVDAENVMELAIAGEAYKKLVIHD